MVDILPRNNSCIERIFSGYQYPAKRCQAENKFNEEKNSNQQASSHIAQGGKQKILSAMFVTGEWIMNWIFLRAWKLPFSHLFGILVDARRLVAVAGGGLHAVKNIGYCLRWSGRLAFVGNRNVQFSVAENQNSFNEWHPSASCCVEKSVFFWLYSPII